MATSRLLIAEYFESGDSRFLGEIQACRDESILKGIADAWFAAARSSSQASQSTEASTNKHRFARHALMTYLEGEIDVEGQRALLKRIFKAAETAKDDELVGCFMVAFDRLRSRKLATRYSWEAQGLTKELVPRPDLVGHYPGTQGKRAKQNGWSQGDRLFSRATRRYLQRRAWRYFRKLAKTDGPRYRSAMLSTLVRYREQSLQSVEQLLDSWSLVHALYYASPILTREPTGVRVSPGKKLESLEPAPFQPQLWKGVVTELVELLLAAQSQTVRSWAIRLVRQEHATAPASFPIETIRRLLAHQSAEAQKLGAELLKGADGLSALTVAQWKSLLALENLEVVSLICQSFLKHVTPDRLTLAECAQLGMSSLAPVATVGLQWAKSKPLRSFEESAPVWQLAEAKVEAVRTDAAKWLSQLLLLNEGPNVAQRLLALLDSKYSPVRATALDLIAKDNRFSDEMLIWLAMAESPWPDVKDALMKTLTTKEARLNFETLSFFFASVLLAVHRGGRARRAALSRVADRIIDRPHEAERLVPLMGIALRSVQSAERRAALAALVRAAARKPSLKALLAQKLPELSLGSGEVAA